MNKKIEQVLFFILFLLLLFTFIFIVFENIYHPWKVIILSGLLFISFVFKYSFLSKLSKYDKWELLCIIGDLIIIFLIGYYSSGISFKIYYFVTIAYVMFNFSLLYGIVSMLVCYGLYLIELYLETGFSTTAAFISKAFFTLLGFIIVVIIMYVVNYVMKQNEVIEKTTHRLKMKTIEQEETYNQLVEAYEKLEERTIKEERNRMGRELHDTLGHTLTTILVEMEAGMKLIEEDFNLALKKFKLARGEVKKGLNDVRNLVRTFKVEEEKKEFIPLLKSLIENTEKHTGVTIRAEIGDLPDLSASQEKTIYRALQEGLTNGIKHGESTAFVFKLKYEDGELVFFLADNGTGCEDIELGFGLKAMQERIKAQGGYLNIESEPEEGC